MSAKKKLNWKELGQFISKALDLFMLIRAVFESRLIDLQIIDWLNGNGEDSLRKYLNLLADEFLETKNHSSPYFRLITPESLILTPTDGTEIIAKARKVFTRFIHGDFVEYRTCVFSQPTDEIKVEVHEMIKDGRFSQIFNSIGENLDQLCLTQSQIILFVQNHKQWLRKNVSPTFFLFKANGEFFVADVRIDSNKLMAYVHRFGSDVVWSVKNCHRIVLPEP